MKTFWTAEECQRIADEEGIDLTGCTLSSIECGPSSISRAQVIASLRCLAAIP